MAAVKAMGGVIPWEKSMRATSPKRSISDMVYVNLFDKWVWKCEECWGAVRVMSCKSRISGTVYVNLFDK